MDDHSKTSKQRVALRAALSVLSCLLVVLSLIVVPVGASPAHANAAAGFNPGRIIDDSRFWVGGEMSAAEIQSFLNSKVQNPTARALRNYTETTSSRVGAGLCRGDYVGKKNETAAQIIAKVGAACEISEKVILVMLQKEQGLITNPSPSTANYQRAMGFGCPDDAYGNANCDPSKSGFFTQVWSAAKRLWEYRNDNRWFNYHPFENNEIMWAPDNVNRNPPKCGTGTVYIENWATAALYIYTPYQPNKAALDNYPGTGNSCSSYGNRNFYAYYKSWFGNPIGADVHPTFQRYWETHRDWLKDPTAGGKRLTVNGGGTMQSFRGGGVYKANAADSQVTGIRFGSPIMNAFIKAGALEGSWGWPLKPGVNQGELGNNVMEFGGGTVVESKTHGTHLIPSSYAAQWKSAGGFTGTWGVPSSAATTRDGYTTQTFSKLTAVRDSKGTVQTLPTEFVRGWTQIGPKVMGLPTKSTQNLSGGKQLEFAGGTVYSSTSGVYGISNTQILKAYRSANGPTGSWGWPIGRQACTSDGTECSVAFQQGVAVWTQHRGVQFAAIGAGGGIGAQPGSGESVQGGATQ